LLYIYFSPSKKKKKNYSAWLIGSFRSDSIGSPSPARSQWGQCFIR
jgi:hypothetical protein